MFSFFTSDNQPPFLNFPFVGPLREHQEKWRNFWLAWMAMVQSGMEMGGEIPVFFQEWAGSTPELLSKLATPDAPLTFLKSVDECLKSLDRAWEKVMRQDSYSKKSAALLSKYLDFHKAFQELNEGWISLLPLASKSQLEEMAKRMAELEKKMAATAQTAEKK